MKKPLFTLSLALVLACAPVALAEHIPPMGADSSSASTARSTHEDHASATADAAVSTAVQVILNLITLGVGH